MSDARLIEVSINLDAVHADLNEGVITRVYSIMRRMHDELFKNPKTYLGHVEKVRSVDGRNIELFVFKDPPYFGGMPLKTISTKYTVRKQKQKAA